MENLSVKISQLILAISLGILCANACYCSDGVDDPSVLQGIHRSGDTSASFSDPEDQAKVPGLSNEASAEPNEGRLASPNKECKINDQGKLDGNGVRTNPFNKALQGGVSQTEIKEPEEALSGEANNGIAAIGISWNLVTRVIRYVDPGSDLFGKVEIGKDKFLGLGALDAEAVVRSHYNLGEAGTWVDAVIRGSDHVVRHIPARRQPLDNFSPKFARSLSRQYKLNR
jgi:hypothetical protein